MSMEHLDHMADGLELLGKVTADLHRQAPIEDDTRHEVATHGVNSVNSLSLAGRHEEAGDYLNSVMSAHDAVSHARKLANVIGRLHPRSQHHALALGVVEGLNQLAVQHEQSHVRFSEPK